MPQYELIYGHEHTKRRAMFDARLKRGEVFVCPWCRKNVDSTMRWHLGHNLDRTDSVPWHLECNLRDAQLKASRTRSYPKRKPEKHPGLIG